jgi:hypothetical protein
MSRWMGAWILAGGALTGLVGCDGGGGQYQTAEQIDKAQPAGHDHDHHDHGHGAEGPHHGTLVELGEHEYHGELVVEAKTHTLKLYLLGPDAKTDATTAATEATLKLEDGPTLTLKPSAGQPEGMASLFEVTDEKAVHEIVDMAFIHGDLAIKIGEKEYKTFVDAHFHADHDHVEEAVKPADPAPAVPATETPSANP